MTFIITFFALIAFVTSLIGLLPQVYKAIKSKSTRDLSMLMLVNYLVCSLAWIVYGAAIHSLAVFASNVVGLVTSLILILQKRYYDGQTA